MDMYNAYWNQNGATGVSQSHLRNTVEYPDTNTSWITADASFVDFDPDLVRLQFYC